MPRLKCDGCGEEFVRPPCHVHKHNFCSFSCYIGWRRGNKELNKVLSDSAKKAYARGSRIAPVPVPRGSSLPEEIKVKMRGRIPWNKGMGKIKKFKGKGKGPRPLEWRIKISTGLRRAYDEGRTISFFKAHGSDPKIIRNRAIGARRLPNKFELQLGDILSRYFSPGEWKYVGDGKIVIGNLIPDFINANGRKLIIEAFGDYWHKRKRPFRSELARARVYQEYGYKLLVIWEHEIKDELEVAAKVKQFMEVM